MNDTIKPLYININSPLARSRISAFLSPTKYQTKSNSSAQSIKRKHFLRKIFPGAAQSIGKMQNITNFQSSSQQKHINNILDNYLDPGSHSEILLSILNGSSKIINDSEII